MLPATYMTLTGLLLYALSPVFQTMDKEDFDALRNSMIEQGAQVSTAIYKGQVEDGLQAWLCLVLQTRPDARLHSGIASSTADTQQVEVS